MLCVPISLSLSAFVCCSVSVCVFSKQKRYQTPNFCLVLKSAFHLKRLLTFFGVHIPFFTTISVSKVKYQLLHLHTKQRYEKKQTLEWFIRSSNSFVSCQFIYKLNVQHFRYLHRLWYCDFMTYIFNRWDFVSEHLFPCHDCCIWHLKEQKCHFIVFWPLFLEAAIR